MKVNLSKFIASSLMLLCASGAQAVVNFDREAVPAEKTPLILRQASDSLRLEGSDAVAGLEELLLASKLAEEKDYPESREVKANLDEFENVKKNLEARGYGVKGNTSLTMYAKHSQLYEGIREKSYEVFFHQNLQKKPGRVKPGRLYPAAYLRAYVVIRCKGSDCQLSVFKPVSAGVKWETQSGPKGAQSSAGGGDDD